jgi:Uma2 family endonuclease
MAVQNIPDSLRFEDREKPYVESIRGRREAKMSPKRRHALVQTRVARILEDWAGDRGEVGVEWRFYLLGDREQSSLVPDVAYVSFARLPRSLPDDARERPRLAPDIAVEIISPGDRMHSLEEKVDLYLAHGCCAVVIIDAQHSSIDVRSAQAETQHADGGRLQVPGFDGLTFPVDILFRDL